MGTYFSTQSDNSITTQLFHIKSSTFTSIKPSIKCHLKTLATEAMEDDDSLNKQIVDQILIDLEKNANDATSLCSFIHEIRVSVNKYLSKIQQFNEIDLHTIKFALHSPIFELLSHKKMHISEYLKFCPVPEQIAIIGWIFWRLQVIAHYESHTDSYSSKDLFQQSIN